MTTKTNPLLDAADYIQANGWCRGSWYNEKGQACLAGAVGLATGALVPLSEKETAALLKTPTSRCTSTHRSRPEAEIPRYKWSKSQAKLRTYTQALTALATEIDATAAGDILDAYSKPETYTWVSDPKERQQMADATTRNRVEGIVIQRNDAKVITEKGVTRHRTTKAQAVALLKRAAKRI